MNTKLIKLTPGSGFGDKKIRLIRFVNFHHVNNFSDFTIVIMINECKACTIACNK